MSIGLSIRTPIKQTTSLCPHCRRQVPAEVYELDDRVYLRKRCPEHGEFDVLINSSRRLYYDACGADCECQMQPEHTDATIEALNTCIALIEIVESCNLKCPTCFADSPFSVREAVQALPLEEFRARVGAVLDRKGNIDILQLSGGEPTIHPRFFELLEGVLTDRRIGYTLINTNGVLMARDPAFMDTLGRLHGHYRHFEIYLQFDGIQPAGQVALRGGDFRKLREDAVAAAGRYGVPVTLAMTVSEDNLAHLGDAMRFGLVRDNVRGICFQPMFRSGRSHIDLHAPARRLNAADIELALIEQSEGLLSEADFTPLPCGNPNCHTIGYLLRRGGEVLPVSRFVDFTQVQGFLRDRVNYDMADLKRCGCESEPLGELLRALEIGPDHVFRLFIKPFMDAWTFDQDRIDRCCVHVIGEGGKLDSFCRHYAMRG